MNNTPGKTGVLDSSWVEVRRNVRRKYKQTRENKINVGRLKM